MQPPTTASFPRRLFKFRTLATPEDKDRCEDILTNHRLWMPSPSTFNDPFDCYPLIVMEGSESERRAYVRQILRSRKLPPRERRKTERHAMARHPAEIAALMKVSHDQWMANTGIVSLSATATNVLLWSHYADSHRGVCLQFSNIFDVRSPFIRALPVTYDEKRPVINVAKDPGDLLETMFLRKADYWAYEEEWRIIDRAGPGYFKFPSLSLDAVILGARACPHTIDLVRSWIKLRKKPTKLLRVHFKDRTFALDVSPLDV